MLITEEVAAVFASLHTAVEKAEESIKAQLRAEEGRLSEALHSEAEKSRRAEAEAIEAAAARDAQLAAEERATRLGDELTKEREEVQKLEEELDRIKEKLEGERRYAREMEIFVDKLEARDARYRQQDRTDARRPPASGPHEEGSRRREDGRSRRREDARRRAPRQESRTPRSGSPEKAEDADRRRGHSPPRSHSRTQPRSCSLERRRTSDTAEAGRQQPCSRSPLSRHERDGNRTAGRRDRGGEAAAGRRRSRSRSLSRHQPEGTRPGAKGRGKHEGQSLCFLYIVEKCRKGDACRDRHPEKNEARSIRERMERTPCRYGSDCTRRDCVFKHPEDRVIRPHEQSEWGERGANGAGTP
mmetsp:Transcript_119019/g.370752  ORF Transcript_119019/g.370752 Transcript_119019/m.370752 type:complete len:358 (-) Transcript_119019:5-1078(-)